MPERAVETLPFPGAVSVPGDAETLNANELSHEKPF